MESQIRKLYMTLAPGLEEVEPGKLKGQCPFCHEDGFMAGGLIDASTGEETDAFLCFDCDRQGSPEEFLGALKELPFTGPTAEEAEPKTGAGQPEVSSNLRIAEEILGFLTLDLPTRELQILLYLQIRGCGISAKEISEELQIPGKNVYRYLAGLEEKQLIYSEGKPKCFLRIEDCRLMDRFRRNLHPQN